MIGDLDAPQTLDSTLAEITCYGANESVEFGLRSNGIVSIRHWPFYPPLPHDSTSIYSLVNTMDRIR
jgi:hypothetical protein